jgi:prolipoprotein diacylglyceryltransferase
MLLVLAFLLWKDRKRLSVGVLTGWFLLLYGVGRFFIEMLRWYETEMILWQSGGLRFTISQVISLAMVVVGIFLIVKGRRTAPVAPHGSALSEISAIHDSQ